MRVKANISATFVPLLGIYMYGARRGTTDSEVSVGIQTLLLCNNFTAVYLTSAIVPWTHGGWNLFVPNQNVFGKFCTPLTYNFPHFCLNS